MNTHPSHELLRSALAGSAAAHDETALAQHLETCEACSAELERLAGGEELCREAAALLAEDELDSAVPIGEGWSEIDFVVEHLEPADEAGVLGRLGGYDVLEIIGRGGMGVVLKGFDRQLKRCVAIKVLAPHLARSSLARQRFAREAQAAAAVVHPHVLAIHQVQPQGRLPFLVMPLVAGQSLAERIAGQGALELKEILRIGMQAAAGLGAAHEQGLVHRDVKPANILLEKGVERAVLTDFGLARAADDVALTRWGIIAGTPEYMSPEQARGEPLDSRSDLFSLGSVLYQMASGVSPFRGDSIVATLRRLVDESPRALSSLNPELPPWLVAIIERLLEKDPGRRFSSAKEVSQLLEGCLAHVQQPATVPLPAGLPKSARRLFRRPSKPIIKGILAMISALAIGFFGFALLGANIPDISGRWTGDDWGDVVLTKSSTGHYTGTYSETSGKQPGEIEVQWSKVERRFNGTWREGNDRFGQISLRVAGDEIRGAYTTDKESKLNPGTPALADLAWTRTDRPKGELAQSGGKPAEATAPAAPRDGGAAEHRPPTPAFEIFVDDPVKVVAYSPDGKTIAVGGGKAMVRLFDAATGKPTITLPPFSEDETGVVWEDEVASPDRVALISVTALAFSPGSHLLAVGHSSGDIKLFDLQHRGAARRLEHSDEDDMPSGKSWRVPRVAIKGLAFSPDGTLLASCAQGLSDARYVSRGWRGGLKIWEVASGKLKLNVQEKGRVDAVAFSSDGQELISAGQWFAQSGNGAPGPVGLLRWNPYNGTLAGDGDVKFNGGVVHSIGLSPDGSRVVVSGASEGRGWLRVVYPASGVVGLTLTDQPPTQVAFLPNAKYFGSFGNPQLFLLRAASDARVEQRIEPPAGSKAEGWNCFAFSPHGDRVAFGGVIDGKTGVRVWNLAGDSVAGGSAQTGQAGVTLSGFGKATAPEGTRAMVVVDLGNNQQIWVAIRHEPDGKIGLYLNGQRTDDAGLNGLAEGLATLGQTPSVEMQSGGIPPLDVSAEMSRVYQLLRGEKAPAEGAPAGAAAVAAPAAEPLMRIETNHAVKRVVCSPDGKKLALITPAANVDQIGLYDADTVKRTAVFDLVDKEEEAGVARAYQAVGSYHVQVTAIEFSPDSSLLAIGSNLGKVRCFDSHSGALQLTLDDPQLHPDEENSDASGNRPDGVRRAYRGSVMSLAFSPDGGTLATSCVVPPSVYGGIGGKPTPPVEAGVKLWNPRTGQLKRLLPYAHAVSFSPDGKQLAAVTTWQAGDCESEWGIKLWNAETGALERLLAIPRKSFGKGTPEFPALAYSSDGARLVLGVSTVAYQAGPAGTTTSSITSDFVDLFDPTKATPVATLDVTGRGPAAFSPDGKVLACLGRPGASSSDSPEARRDFNLVTLIDATNGRLVGEIRSPLPAATNWNCFTFIPGSGRIAIGGLNGVFGVTVWAVPKVTLPPSLIHLER